MIVKHAMGEHVITVPPDAPVLEAARLMNDNRIGGLVVTEKENVIGIITERDIISKIIVQNGDPRETMVKDVMSSPAETISPETGLEDAATKMVNHKIRRLPVVANQKLEGIITSSDIVNFYIDAEKIVWESAIRNLAKVKGEVRRMREPNKQ